MTTQTTTRGRVARWAACALVAVACLCVGSVPARADDTPVRIASATPTAPEPGTLMPGNEIKMNISIRYGLDGSGTDTLDTVEVTIRLSPWGLDNDFQVEDCQAIADTFWSGSHPDFKSKASLSPVSCDLEATYYREARHAFYSMDESGHLQLRAPMEYFQQMADSFEKGTITELSYYAPSMVNGQCNFETSYSVIDEPLVANAHSNGCVWQSRQGTVIPITDEPLLEGDADEFFTTYKEGTVGAFTDLVAPVNPFTLPTPEPTTPPAAGSSTAGDSTDGQSDSTGLLIGIGAAIAALLLVGAGALVVALRRRH
ncbi:MULTISPECIES: hypothetical protein [Actinomycetaceae]|uniref:hypothetical protein n=1 Tax=Actinomycetaceae TaxID=2049 RepID=UPI0003982055|nr:MULTISPECIES: hypothetical protein [Actinomycetaceae]ERH21520.1 hypothetical protein HMPREF1980_02355 [Actinomyces sp. oral taxon 172 str. F0311]WLD78375.1 hypothetical protein QU663_01740 [Schaalia sp. HMT-172]